MWKLTVQGGSPGKIADNLAAVAEAIRAGSQVGGFWSLDLAEPEPPPKPFVPMPSPIMPPAPINPPTIIDTSIIIPRPVCETPHGSDS